MNIQKKSTKEANREEKSVTKPCYKSYKNIEQKQPGPYYGKNVKLSRTNSNQTTEQEIRKKLSQLAFTED